MASDPRTAKHTACATLTPPSQIYRCTAGPELPPSWEEEKEKEERKTKASSIFKAAASLCRGPGWRCKPASLIETKLQVQREVIRKPPSGSMLPFKFHLIKPKEKKPLSLLSPSPDHPSPTPKQPGPSSGPPLPPSFLLSQGGGGHPPPSLILIVRLLQRPGLCPFFTRGSNPSSHPSSENHLDTHPGPLPSMGTGTGG